MNNNYYPNNNNNSNNTPPFSMNSYNNPNHYQNNNIYNLLKRNIGKIGTFYFTFPESVDNRDKSFKGILEDIGNDYILISDSSNGKWYMFMVYFLNYIEFEEEINK
ncbi:MAG: spore coat protein GerQ [Bacilli bacterium]